LEFTKEVIKSFLIGIIIGLIALPTPAYADCSQPVQVIKEGEAAQCSGFLFSPDAEKEAATARDNAEYYTKLADAYQARAKVSQDENQILEQRLKLYMDSTANLSKEVSSRDNNSNLYYLASFSLGVIATALIVKNVRP
jgi:hypothetical protein